VIEDEKPIQNSQKNSSSGSSNEDLVKFYCQKYSCSSAQLLRVMRCESGGNYKAANGIYSGLFQFSPSTFSANAAKAGLKNADIWNTEHQIQTAAYMFAEGQAGQWSCK
jgi:hypothetical protein